MHQLLPNDGEVGGLLALMLLTDARRAARTGPAGELIPLDEQDRALWNRDAIAEGVALVSAALTKGLVGEYQLQAAIAALHDEAARPEETDWPQIFALYSVLKRMTDNPMVAISHAIAAAMVRRTEGGTRLARAATRTTSDCEKATGSTRPAPISWNAPASTPRRRSCIERLPRKPPACRREITCSSRPRVREKARRGAL